jgi:hypothetical protein
MYHRIEVQDEIGQVSRDTSSLQDITSPAITEEYEDGIEVQNEIVPPSYSSVISGLVISCNDDVSRGTWPISSCTSIPPSCSLVISGLVMIEVQDEIGQLSRDTSPLQDITSPEITEEYEGGIEVQDEIGQASRDTYLNSTFVFLSNFWTGDIL